MRDDSPSATARRVAAHRLEFDRVQAPYGDADADLKLAADVADGLEVPAGRMHDYLRARTAFFDRVVVRALDRGVRQVVVGAAGYDGRAYRYAKPGVRWFEVDHPATQRDKRARLRRLEIRPGHVRFIAADFTRDRVADLLLSAELDAKARSLFLLEGVAVYLEAAVLESLLGQFRQVAASGSHLAISVSLAAADAGARSGFRNSVAAMGEPVRSTLEPAEARDLLARTGWRITGGAEPDDSEERARRDRLRSAGLLMARAAPRATHRVGARSGPATAGLAGRWDETAVADRGSLPLAALLSQALVAFTIEFDNEAEHRMPHRTTDYGPGAGGDGLWLVSMVMWLNCMRFVGEDPITVGELKTLARTGSNLAGMRRWGYITIEPDPPAGGPRRPLDDALIRATAKGLRARETWRPLTALIEDRWRERLGEPAMGRFRESLQALVARLDPRLPDCLPILGYPLRSRGPDPASPGSPAPEPAAGTGDEQLPLSALLARVLLAYAIEFEREADLPLAISANALRVQSNDGVPIRDIPSLAGVSKEAVSMATGRLVNGHYAVLEPAPGRGKLLRLTPKGVQARQDYGQLTARIEDRWRARFGDVPFAALRTALEQLATGAAGEPPPLFRGLNPYPDGWRARVRRPRTLPHYPMVLHRGGFPDGS